MESEISDLLIEPATDWDSDSDYSYNADSADPAGLPEASAEDPSAESDNRDVQLPDNYIDSAIAVVGNPVQHYVNKCLGREIFTDIPDRRWCKVDCDDKSFTITTNFDNSENRKVPGVQYAQTGDTPPIKSGLFTFCVTDTPDSELMTAPDTMCHPVQASLTQMIVILLAYYAELFRVDFNISVSGNMIGNLSESGPRIMIMFS